MSTTKTIQVGKDDLRAGDKVTFKPSFAIKNGEAADEPITATVVVTSAGSAYAAGYCLTAGQVGEFQHLPEFISATREVPVRKLPTKPGSMIRFDDQVAILGTYDWLISGQAPAEPSTMLANFIDGTEWEELRPVKRITPEELLTIWDKSNGPFEPILGHLYDVASALGVEVIDGE